MSEKPLKPSSPSEFEDLYSFLTELQTKQEQIKKDFEEKRERREKRISDYGILSATLLAAAFAGWATYEAHDAGATARNALQVQRESFQLDERPFVYVEPVRLIVRPASSTDYKTRKQVPEISIEAVFKVASVGRTPAFHVAVDALMTYNEKSEGKSDYIGPLMLNESAEWTVHYSIPHSNSPGAIRLKGSFTYRDLFKVKHHSPLCEDIVLGSATSGEFDSCVTSNDVFD